MKAKALMAGAALVAAAALAQDADFQIEGKTNREKEEMEGKVSVVIETTLGNIELALDAEKAPLTVANFLSYVDEGFYNGTIFHRVIPNFMVQGGGFTPAMVQKRTRGPVKNEADNGLKNGRGTIAMARTSIVDSATSQFFINSVDNAFLDFRSPSPQGYGYAVFGRVTSGMDVVDAISGVRTGVRHGMRDVPLETVEIKAIRRGGL